VQIGFRGLHAITGRTGEEQEGDWKGILTLVPALRFPHRKEEESNSSSRTKWEDGYMKNIVVAGE
jgi:hypothetical protein